MTDLERAAAVWYTTISTEATVHGKIHALASALAAARREGEEVWRGKLATQCGKTLAAAAEMRERAQRATTFCCFECSRVIAALPLTPEEPT